MISTDISILKNIPYTEQINYIVYSLVNLDNGKRYIGRSQNPKQRIHQHFIGIKSHKHPNKLINAESECRFGYEILEENIPFSERTDKERYYILKYKTYLNEYGYNAKDPCLGRKRRFKNKT